MAVRWPSISFSLNFLPKKMEKISIVKGTTDLNFFPRRPSTITEEKKTASDQLKDVHPNLEIVTGGMAVGRLSIPVS